MPLVALLKGKDKYYLFSDNSQYIGGAILERKAPRQFRIQKFKNFVVGYNGEAPTFQKFVKKFDLDSFPVPLTKSYLMRNFYKEFLDFLVEETDCEIKNGALYNSNFGIFILGKDYAFDIGDEYLYEIRDLNAMGDDNFAFYIHNMYKNNFSSEELIDLIMQKTVKYSFKVSYPFIMVTSDDLDTLKIIRKDGKVEKIKLVEHWGKNNA